jgi:hypothetical protein
MVFCRVPAVASSFEEAENSAAAELLPTSRVMLFSPITLLH